ncbi:MAG: hypothetical protein SFT81_07580 [Candidatus Caenarcaniphilales bacterium]|nr:hypothetical protein [Candidatus Caenarcaniphilales bacterium]
MAKTDIKSLLNEMLHELKNLPGLHKDETETPTQETSTSSQESLYSLLNGRADGHAKFLPSRTWAWFTDEKSWDDVTGVMEVASSADPIHNAPPKDEW